MLVLVDDGASGESPDTLRRTVNYELLYSLDLESVRGPPPTSSTDGVSPAELRLEPVLPLSHLRLRTLAA